MTDQVDIRKARPEGNTMNQVTVDAKEYEQLRLDAMRYRWLRDPATGGPFQPCIMEADYDGELLEGELADEAIDRAIEVSQ